MDSSHGEESSDVRFARIGQELTEIEADHGGPNLRFCGDPFAQQLSIWKRGPELWSGGKGSTELSDRLDEESRRRCGPMGWMDQNGRLGVMEKGGQIGCDPWQIGRSGRWISKGSLGVIRVRQGN